MPPSCARGRRHPPSEKRAQKRAQPRFLVTVHGGETVKNWAYFNGCGVRTPEIGVNNGTSIWKYTVLLGFSFGKPVNGYSTSNRTLVRYATKDMRPVVKPLTNANLLGTAGKITTASQITRLWAG